MTSVATRLDVEIVRTPERLAEIGPTWTALWSGAGRSVFQSYAWVEAWWSSLPGEARPGLKIALGWRQGDLVAVLPLVVQRRRGLRALEWAAKDHTDYCDALVAASGADADDMLRRLWAGVVASRGFDLAYLSHLLPDAAVLPVFARAGAGMRLRLSHRREASLRVRSAATTGQAWFDGLPKKTRQNYRRGHKLLAEAGPVAFREIGPAEPLGLVLDRLAELKRDWLVRTGNRSSILDECAAPLRALVGALAAQGLLRIFVLECDGSIAAMSVNFVERGRMMAFFNAYDHAHERASLGTIVMIDYMMRAFDDGLEEVDFLCGAEEYKSRFATSRVELVSMAGGRTLAGRAAVAADAWGPTVREWRSRLRSAWAARRPVVATEVEGQPRRA